MIRLSNSRRLAACLYLSPVLRSLTYQYLPSDRKIPQQYRSEGTPRRPRRLEKVFELRRFCEQSVCSFRGRFDAIGLSYLPAFGAWHSRAALRWCVDYDTVLLDFRLTFDYHKQVSWIYFGDYNRFASLFPFLAHHDDACSAATTSDI